MGNRQSYAKFQENLFRSNEIISIVCPPLFRKQPIPFILFYGISKSIFSILFLILLYYQFQCEKCNYLALNGGRGPNQFIDSEKFGPRLLGTPIF